MRTLPSPLYPSPQRRTQLARLHDMHARYSLPPPTFPAPVNVTIPRPSLDVPLALVAGTFGALAGIVVTTIVAVLS